MAKMKTVVAKGRAEQLTQLLKVLADTLDEAEPKERAPLAKQYRETLRELEELKGAEDGDEIGELLNSREADGISGTVRASRARV